MKPMRCRALLHMLLPCRRSRATPAATSCALSLPTQRPDAPAPALHPRRSRRRQLTTRSGDVGASLQGIRKAQPRPRRPSRDRSGGGGAGRKFSRVLRG